MSRCLVVDDSAPIRKVAMRILEAVNLHASEAGTHTDAIDHCAREMPDCIIVDWMMPNDGPVTRFLSALRALPGGETAKIIYLTSEYAEADFATARRHGADALMMKPFDREAFLRPLVEVGIV